MEFASQYVTTIPDDAKIYPSHAKKATVDGDDVWLAIQCHADQFLLLLPQKVFIRYGKAKKSNPFSLFKPYSGSRLLPDIYYLTAPNYRIKSLQNKASASTGRIIVPWLSVGSVTSRPSIPTLGKPTPQTMSVLTKVGTPMSLIGKGLK